MYYRGVDVHNDDSQVSVLDHKGGLAAEQRLENDRFDERATVYEGSKVTLEATGNYFAIYDALISTLRLPLPILARPRQSERRVEERTVVRKASFPICGADVVAESYVPAEFKNFGHLHTFEIGLSICEQTSKTRFMHS